MSPLAPSADAAPAAPAASEFLLEPADIDDDLAFRAPPREGTRVQPLVDGVASLAAMEEEVAKARALVHLACWLFNPDTPVQSKAVRRLGAPTWGALLALAAAGQLLPRRERPGSVRVRVLLSDFDPVLQNDLHRNAWSSYRRLLKHAETLSAAARARFEIVLSRHPATEAGATALAEPALRSVVRQLNAIVVWDSIGHALRRFEDMPGVWGSVVFDPATERFAPADEPELTVHLASHHEKVCVVDGKVAFCGGVDVTPGAADTTAHRSATASAHVVHARVEGPAVADLDRSFRARWNAERAQHAAFVDAANAAQPPLALPKLEIAPVDGAPVEAAAVPGGGVAQVERTRSGGGVARGDVADVYERAIGRAETFVYLEQRYLRSAQLADWLIARREDVADLQLLVVVPVVPEEAALPGELDDVVRHGLHLQHEAITRLRAAFGERLGVYSLLKRRAASGTRRTNYLGSPQLGVHSSCLIVDDVFACVGSANVTDRSFRLDSEAAVAWFDPASVKALREQLWRELLGTPPKLARWPAAEYLTEWNAIAAANARAAPAQRRGFVVPHDPENPALDGRRDLGLRSELAELVETDPAAVADYLPPLRPDRDPGVAGGQPPLTDQERDLVSRALPLAFAYEEVAEVLFVVRQNRDPVRVPEGRQPDGAAAEDARVLTELLALIRPEIEAYEERAGREFRELSAFVRASFGEGKSGPSKAQAVANYLMVRPLYVRGGYADPAGKIFTKIKRPADGAKLLEHDIVGGAHERFVAKLQELRALLDTWNLTGPVSDALKAVGGFVPVVPDADGTFRPRFVAGQGAPVLSNHALGLAIDVDAEWNPQIPSGSETITVLKQITAQIASENPSLGLPAAGFDFGRTFVDPALRQWPEIGQAVSAFLVAQRASDAISSWLRGRIERETRLNADLDTATAAVKAAEEAKRAATASGDRARADAAQVALTEAKNARKVAKAAIDDDPDLKRLRRLRQLQGGGNKGKRVVEDWAERGIQSLPLALVAGFKLLDHIRWGMEYKTSKDGMHFEVHPASDFVVPDAPRRSGPRDLLPRRP